jgi:hypothetical protein
LQTRVAKRPAQAAVRFAVDAVAEGLLSREQALLTIDAAGLDALMHPSFAAGQEFSLLTTGVAASPGPAEGQIVFSGEDAVDWAERGHRGESGAEAHVGSAALTDALERVRPRLLVAGHIHSGYGNYQLGDTEIINASLVDNDYRLSNPVVRLALES